MKIVRRVATNLIFGFFLLGLALSTFGCRYFPESTFDLASDSRLPRWVTLPPGLTRTDVSVTMSYYIKPWGTSARFIVQNGKRIIQKVDGKLTCKESIHLKNTNQEFPTYEPITINGVTEIIEHRKMEPIFHVIDDPTIWKQYSAIGCS